MYLLPLACPELEKNGRRRSFVVLVLPFLCNYVATELGCGTAGIPGEDPPAHFREDFALKSAKGFLLGCSGGGIVPNYPKQ